MACKCPCAKGRRVQRSKATRRSPIAAGPSMRRCVVPKAIRGVVGDYIGDAPSSAECALSQPRTVREHGKSARSHNGGDVYSFGGLRNVSVVACSSALPPALNFILCSSFTNTHIGQYRHPANRTPVPWLRFHRLPAEWPFVTPYRTWRPLGMSQSNPSADLALQPLL